MLADESLLSLVLHSIPENYDYINVTMGYPMKNSPVYDLIFNIFRLHQNRKDGNCKAY